jgi:hypothetical protein
MDSDFAEIVAEPWLEKLARAFVQRPAGRAQYFVNSLWSSCRTSVL